MDSLSIFREEEDNHMPAFQRCPFCERTFELGPEERGPMKRHIQTSHPDEDTDESVGIESSFDES